MTAPSGGSQFQSAPTSAPHLTGAPPGYPPSPGYVPQGQPPGYPSPGSHAPPPGYPSPGGQVPPSSFPAPGGQVPPGYRPPPGYPPLVAQGFSPPPGYPPTGPPIVIDVGKTHGRQAAIGAIVAGVIGLIAVISGLVGAVDGGSGAAIAAIVIGALFLLPAVITVAMRNKVFRPRALVFEPTGVRWDDPRGAPWAVPWSELAAVAVSKHSPKQGPETVSDKISGAAVEKMLGERAHVRLDLYPADPGFAGRHPEMAHLWERQGVKYGYRLPLGANVKFIPLIAQGMGRFAPNIYRGVVATEGMMGLS